VRADRVSGGAITASRKDSQAKAGAGSGAAEQVRSHPGSGASSMVCIVPNAGTGLSGEVAREGRVPAWNRAPGRGLTGRL